MLAQLPRTSQAPADRGNALQGSSVREQQLFVTLHCLFPNELLPALDLLDRRLVTRMVCADQAGHRPVFQVRSSQPPSRSRFQGGVRTSYEVRLTAWNCSCPAFVFAAFAPAAPAQLDTPMHGRDHPGLSASAFGGLTLAHQTLPPVCKHLLACLLAETCQPLFDSHVLDMQVSRDELAGWVAGWGA